MSSEKSDGEISMSSRGPDHQQTSAFTATPEHERRTNPRKGKFIVVDGLDGIGKGEIETALRRYEERKGKSVFDAIAWSQAWEQLPELEDFWGIPRPHFNTLMTAEPTYVEIGKSIRDEITKRNGRVYSARTQIEAYSLDRLVQMKRVVVPALEHGLNVIQSRCMASTLTYQVLKAIDENRDIEEVWKEILSHEGNIYQANNPPDLLIIPTIKSTQELQERLRERGKNEKEDVSEFENAEFQGRLKPLYDSEKLRSYFESLGTKVAYLDAGKGINESRIQGTKIYRFFLKNGGVEERYRTPESAIETASNLTA